MGANNDTLWSMLTGLSCSSIVDAMNRIHRHRSHILDLVSPTPQRRLFGPAATVAYLPYRDDFTEANRLGFGGWYYRAVGDDPAGKVLVLSSGGYPEAAHGGGTKMSRLHNDRLAGLVSDGRLRDFAELAEFDFVTWCTGETTRWGGDMVAPCAANVPVEVGGVSVVPGDYVYADSSGAVVIPAASVREALYEARSITDADRDFTASIRYEDPEAVRSGEHRSTEH